MARLANGGCKGVGQCADAGNSPAVSNQQLLLFNLDSITFSDLKGSL